MVDRWLLVVDTLLALGAFCGLLRLHRTLRRDRRQVQVKLATLARALDRERRRPPREPGTAPIFTTREQEALLEFKGRRAHQGSRLAMTTKASARLSLDQKREEHVRHDGCRGIDTPPRTGESA